MLAPVPQSGPSVGGAANDVPAPSTSTLPARRSTLRRVLVLETFPRMCPLLERCPGVKAPQKPTLPGGPTASLLLLLPFPCWCRGAPWVSGGAASLYVWRSSVTEKRPVPA